jgi:hypothetical protein
MNKRTMAFFAVIALAACDTPTSPASISRKTPQAASFDNTAVKINETTDISGTIVSPCTGEPIVYQGSAHIMSTLQPTTNGFTVSTHFNTQSVSGVGAVTGTKYQIVDAFNEDETVVSSNGTADVAEHFRVISDGSLDNFLVDLVYTFTFPPPAFTYETRNRRCVGSTP